jgi:hypothetical protein
MKRLGPELKMPKLKGSEMKVPPFLSDLYYDLRDRRLLPIVALILVAIVAAPILLGGGSDEPEVVPGPKAVTGEAAPSSQPTLTVVKAQPGLRDYKKRLGHRKPTNPFKQRFNGPSLNGAELNEQTTSTSTTSETSGSSSETVVTSPSSNETGGTSGGSGEGGSGGGGETKLYTFTIDVQISRTEEQQDGSVKMGEPVAHHKVKPLTPLPGDKAPAVTYLGIDLKTQKALFMVSKDVTATFGDAKCISGTDICELMEVEPGFPETFEYGPNHVRYKFKIIDIDVVRDGHL